MERRVKPARDTAAPPAAEAVRAPQPGAEPLLLTLYRTMRRIRSFEERVGELFVRQQTAGSMLHLSIGEEAAATGVCHAFEPQDSFTTHHRGHGVFLARGADPKRMMAEIAGKTTGYCRGKGGSMHIADMALGHLGANAIVGGGIPAVVGAGLSSKYFKKNAVSVAFFGDGAMGQGILYESMNMAGLWGLPVLFVCINNQYGMGTRVDQATKFSRFDERARTFGLDGAMADGEDVEAVATAARRLVDGARKEGRPGYLAVDCYRFFGHARMDKSPYRSPEEEERGRKRDPVARARKLLLERERLAEADLAALDGAIAAEMDATLDYAVQGELPALDTMFRDVYADGEPAPEPVATRLARIFSKE
jgi:TPP-dependent pyruvate/acetoin dehydrogenase alpha subunit